MQQRGLSLTMPSLRSCYGSGDPTDLSRIVEGRTNGSTKMTEEQRNQWLQEESVKQLHRCSIFRGSDIRLGTGVVMDPRVWPRREVQAWRWEWKTTLSYALEGQHLNVLEMQAILTALRWRLKRQNSLRLRCVHLTDSFICIAVLAKGRTSARVLHKVVRKINALILASSTTFAYGHVRSARNPADRPSRWRRVISK